MSEIETIPAPPSFETEAETGTEHAIPEQTDTEKICGLMRQLVSDLDQSLDTKLDAFARSLGDEFDKKVRQIDGNIALLKKDVLGLREFVGAIHRDHERELSALRRRVDSLEAELSEVRRQLADMTGDER